MNDSRSGSLDKISLSILELMSIELRCIECNKTFKRAAILRDHLRSHRNEKPFQCRKCYKAFTRKNDMKRHEDTHSEKQFCCGTCGKQFTRHLALSKHTAMHTQVSLHTGNTLFERGHSATETPAEPVRSRELSNRLSSHVPYSRDEVEHSFPGIKLLLGVDSQISPNERNELFRALSSQSSSSSNASEEHRRDPQLVSSMDLSLYTPIDKASNRHKEDSSTRLIELNKNIVPLEKPSDRHETNDGDAISLTSHPVSDLALILAENNLSESPNAYIHTSTGLEAINALPQGGQDGM
jgi:hypothetical protein